MTEDRESGEHVPVVKGQGGIVLGVFTAIGAAIAALFGAGWTEDENDDHHETTDG